MFFIQQRIIVFRIKNGRVYFIIYVHCNQTVCNCMHSCYSIDINNNKTLFAIIDTISNHDKLYTPCLCN